MPEAFQDLQYRFTRHLRDPEHCPAPGDVEDRRMEIYRGLLYRNVESFVSGGFPVLRRIVEDAAWHVLVRNFFKTHRSRTPYFPKLAQEFLHYLERERGQWEADFPFMLELAQYEYAESELLLDARTLPKAGYDPDGELLEGYPVLNPVLMLLMYTWPVHRISPDYLPKAPPETPTYLLICRDRNDQISFSELNPVSARLVQCLQSNDRPNGWRRGRDVLLGIAEELQSPDPESVVAGGRQMLEDFRRKEILLGAAAVGD